jgi:hypothetical protein
LTAEHLAEFWKGAAAAASIASPTEPRPACSKNTGCWSLWDQVAHLDRSSTLALLWSTKNVGMQNGNYACLYMAEPPPFSALRRSLVCKSDTPSIQRIVRMIYSWSFPARCYRCFGSNLTRIFAPPPLLKTVFSQYRKVIDSF